MKLENIIATRKAKTIYREGNQTVKIYDEDSKVDVLSQALTHALIEETGIKVPKMLDVTTKEGKMTIIYEYIVGETLDVLMERYPEKEDEYLDMFLKLQMSIHEKRAPGLKKLRDKMRAKISISSLSDTVKYDLHVRLTSMPKHEKICHGDFNPSNIVITESGEAYVIDWAHATQGNASADVARTYLLFCLDGKEALAEKYLNLFCEKSGTTRAYVQKWLPIVAASQSVKNIPKEAELLHKWIDVVEFE
ncbi:MAG: phosphotransferase [Clostridia bacterium]|nr:phosphotransferase [Clostridia bacterium]